MILGTAGHIDHGKTALVRALTGVDTDRLPEEKRRGITIALGFAPLELEGVGVLGVVDVPGHEAFVRTMVAGATGIDLALLVVAADEGMMPQTREHLSVLALLGIRHGVIALSKADLLEPELVALMAEEVRDAVLGSPLADAAIIPVSATRGTGIDALRAALATTARAVPPRDPGDLWRLPIDRVFSVAGAGTVVTGTAWSGSIAREARVRVLPAGLVARVRSVESHGRASDHGTAGGRVALALAGVSREEIPAGSVVVREEDPWSPSRILRADVSLLPGTDAIGPRRRLRFHLGTSEVGARVIASGGALEPGMPRASRVVLDAPVVARAGDRFVLRGGEPHRTIGGGVVSDPSPAHARAKPWSEVGAASPKRLGWMIEEGGHAGLDTRALPVRLGVRPAEIPRLLRDVERATLLGERLVANVVLERARATLLTLVDRAHAEHPLSPGVDRQSARHAISPHALVADEVIRRAERARLIEVEGAWLRRAGFMVGATPEQRDDKERVHVALRAAGAEPPSVAELSAQLGFAAHPHLKLLGAEGRAVAVALDRWWAREGVDLLLARLRDGVAPGRVYSPAELRDLLGVSRKYLIPFLEWCDRERISDRATDGRTFHGMRPTAKAAGPVTDPADPA